MEEYRLLFHRICDSRYPIRQIAITFGHLQDEIYEQWDLFADRSFLEKERKLQQTLIQIKDRYGNNSVLKGMNMLEAATARYRNNTIGGHRA